MVRLTRLNGTKIVLNALLIERIEQTPDTILTLTTGRQFVIRETPDEVAAAAVEYLRSVRGDQPHEVTLGQIARAIK